MGMTRSGGGGTLSLVGAAMLALAALPGAVGGQMTGECDVPRHNGFVTLSLSNGSHITYFSAPTIVCPGNTRISADSAVVYEATNYTQLFRHVVFQDAESRLTADQAHYFDQERRLRAWGYVVLTDLAEGSIIRGDTMVLLRAGPNRPEDQLTVLGRRPHATLYPTLQELPDTTGTEESPEEAQTAQDTTGVPSGDTLVAPTREIPVPDSAGVVPPDTGAVAPEAEAPTGPVPEPSPAERKPYEIRAQRMFLEGSRYFRATGGVAVDRDSVSAAADSLEYDETLGALFLAREASLTTSIYRLSAATIRLDIPREEIRNVLAREEAVLEGEDLWLLAPTISLVMDQGQVQRLIAVHGPPEDSVAPSEGSSRNVPSEVREKGIEKFPSRPHALAQDFLLWADSIEVLVPEEVLKEVWAMGTARGESLARDSLNTPDTPPLIRRDWLEGDTIIAIFVPNADSSAVAPEGVPIRDVPLPPSSGVGDQDEAATDSAAYRLDHLVARVRARSLYRLAPTDSTASIEDGRLAIHYVTGDEITIFMKEGEVDRMEVAGATRGIHMEPVADRRAVIPPDTTLASSGGKGRGGR